MHPNEGQLRAYLDQELEPVAGRAVEAHLQTCARCQSAADQLRARATSTAQQMAFLDLPPQAAFRPATAARRQLELRLENQNKESYPMLKHVFSRLSRPAWAALAVSVLLALSLIFPPVRAIANSFLGLFRVEQIRVVQINPGDMPALGQSGRFESLMTRDVQFTQLGETQPVDSAAAAEALVGFPVRTLNRPTPPEPTITVQQGGTMTFEVDLALVNGVLEEIGRPDITIPAGLDGETVSLTVPQGVMVNYGECKFDPQAERAEGYDPDDPNRRQMPACTTLYQLPSPEIEAPEGLDLSALGEAYLQILGMNPTQAQQFAANVDWTSTFILPVPQSNTRYRELPVDGVTGTLIEHVMSPTRVEYLFVWVKDGILYALMGPGDFEAAVEMTSTLR